MHSLGQGLQMPFSFERSKSMELDKRLQRGELSVKGVHNGVAFMCLCDLGLYHGELIVLHATMLRHQRRVCR